MTGYLLIESRDPGESTDAGYFYGLAGSLARDGVPVTLVLVQNGVFPTRPSAHSHALAALTRAGVEVLADEFSLRERGISQDRLVPGVSAVSLDIVIDRLAEGRKAVWH